MKSKLNLLLITLLVCSLFLVATPQFSMAQTGTNVSGIINSDTTWTKANSPYTLTGPTAVTEGVTLTIEAGATVNLGTNYLLINGTLSARGTLTENIHFNANTTTASVLAYNGYISFTSISSTWNEQTNAGSIIENAILTSTSIRTIDASPKINNNTFTGAFFENSCISIQGGSTIISNCSIIRTYHPFGGYYGISCIGSNYYDSTNNAYISRNHISGWRIVGIAISAGSPIIEYNLIENNGIDSTNGNGIQISTIKSTPIIRNNTIIKNPVGIRIVNEPHPTIAYNNFQENTQHNIYLETSDIVSNPKSIDASNNWWGKIDAQAINQTIYDYKNNSNLGKVDFVPFLTEPNPNAPDIPPEPTPTPTPTPTPAPTATPTPTPTVTPSPTPTSTLTPTNTPQPTMTPTPTLTFTPTPTVDPTQSPTPANEETPTPSPTVEPTATTQPTNSLSPTLSPSQEPTASPDQTQMQALPQEALYGAVAAVIAIIAVVAVIALKKRK